MLLSLLPSAEFAFVVDDLKAGATFQGLPVLTLTEAGRIPGARVCLCARPAYVPLMRSRLHKQGLEYVVLSPPAAASVRVPASRGARCE